MNCLLLKFPLKWLNIEMVAMNQFKLTRHGTVDYKDVERRKSQLLRADEYYLESMLIFVNEQMQELIVFFFFKLDFVEQCTWNCGKTYVVLLTIEGLFIKKLQGQSSETLKSRLPAIHVVKHLFNVIQGWWIFTDDRKWRNQSPNWSIAQWIKGFWWSSRCSHSIMEGESPHQNNVLFWWKMMV